MTSISIDTNVLRRALHGDDTAQQEARKLLRTTEPPTGLLGRWAKHPDHGNVLITSEKPYLDSSVYVAYLNEVYPYGTGILNVPLEELTFSEQTTNPEDVPPGEAWLAEVNGKQLHTIKFIDGDWLATGKRPAWRSSSDITLISPLVPARPTDSTDEWVETEEEYAALPEGSIVATDRDTPWIYERGTFWQATAESTPGRLAGTRRRVLRKGWGNDQ